MFATANPEPMALATGSPRSSFNPTPICILLRNFSEITSLQASGQIISTAVSSLARPACICPNRKVNSGHLLRWIIRNVLGKLGHRKTAERQLICRKASYAAIPTEVARFKLLTFPGMGIDSLRSAYFWWILSGSPDVSLPKTNASFD